MTEAEYLEFEKHATDRHEYYKGEIFALAGGARNHNVIAGNVTRELGNRLPKHCIAVQSDMRVWVDAADFYTYPDVVAVCGEEQYRDEAQTTLTNPDLIVEVLSESTEAYDRGDKFEFYRTIPSLDEVVFVTQVRKHVEVFRRRGDHWALYEVTGDTVRLDSVGVSLAMEAIYERVVWESDQEDGSREPAEDA